MYKTFFGLRESPFNVNPDPRFLYLTPQTRAAMDELTYGIQNRKGFILLTGEVGTGKTTLINYLLNWLRARKTPTAFIFNSHLSANHLFDFILTDFGIPSDYRFNNNMLMRLNTWLIERFRAGERPVLIIDEAQGLSSELLEEIRLLLNLETATEKLLQIVLAGQPELEQKLKRPELRQLQQRITLRCNTGALSPAECHGYIAERLRIGGATRDDIFAPEAMDAVYFYSQGIPRVVNLLCEHALINAYVEHSTRVGARMVEDAAREFLLDERRSVVMRRNAPEPGNANLAVMHTIFSDGLGSQLAGEEQQSPIPVPVLQAVKTDFATVMMQVPKLQKKAEPVTLLDVANKSQTNELSGILPLLAASAKQKTQSPIVNLANAGPVSGQSLHAGAKAAASVAPIAAAAIDNKRNVIVAPVSSTSAAGIGDGKPAAARSLPVMAEWQSNASERANAAATQSTQPIAPRTMATQAGTEKPSRSAQWLRSPMAVTLPGISHTTLLKLMATMLSLRFVLGAWAREFRRDWQAMIRTTPWPRMKQGFMHWLSQPIRSEVWQPTKSRPMPSRRGVVTQKT